MVLQRNNGRDYVERVQSCLEALDLCFNDALGMRCFFFPALDMRRDGALQIVDVIDKDAVQLVHLGINVARNCDVDEKHWPILAPVQEEFAMLPPEDGNRSAGRSNDDACRLAMID